MSESMKALHKIIRRSVNIADMTDVSDETKRHVAACAEIARNGLLDQAAESDLLGEVLEAIEPFTRFEGVSGLLQVTDAQLEALRSAYARAKGGGS